MTLAAQRRSQTVHAALLLLCGIALTVLAIGADAVARSNQVRRDQIRRLAEVLARPEQVDEGALVGFEGMFGRRLRRISTPAGPAVVFADIARGRRT